MKKRNESEVKSIIKTEDEIVSVKPIIPQSS
jgi:hypothetical protein